MTRYAVVKEGKKYVVVPESRVGDRDVFCFYIGHIEAARKFATDKEKDDARVTSYGARIIRDNAKRNHGRKKPTGIVYGAIWDE